MRTFWGCLIIGLLWGLPSYGAGEQATAKAALTEVDESGNQMFGFGTHELTLNVRGETPSSFTFTASDDARRFAILLRRTDECGKVHYLAFEDLGRSRKMPARLSVVDNTDNKCGDPEYQWNVTLAAPREDKRYFGGNAEPVVDATACLAQVASTMCVMIYAPATCEAATLDGGVTPFHPVATASAGNSCQAIMQLRAEACVRGIDPARLTDADISCKVDFQEEP